MRTKTAAAVLIAVALTVASVAAFGPFYQPLAEGVVTPQAAPAFLTCYTVDGTFDLVAGASRPDVLSTFVTRDRLGHTAKVCYLRTTAAADWQPDNASQEQPITCDQFGNCHNGNTRGESAHVR